jgi:hypothetical protein
MSGLYYLVFGVAILIIIWWCMSNDAQGSEQNGEKGLLAMRAPVERKPDSDSAGP